MPSAQDPEDLRAVLLQLAAASATEPSRRTRVANWMRAALQLLDDGDRTAAEPTPQQAFALRELAENLAMAAEHAVWLAHSVERITQRSRPE